MAPPSFVVTATPHRVSLLGGGTDLPDFFEHHRGAVVSLTIKKFLYVTVKRHSSLFGEQYRLNYSSSEHTDSVDDIQNDIMRECLKLVPVEAPLYISTVSDLPASSGLGSSGAFAVGLLHALHVMRGEDVTLLQLADEASTVEIEKLSRPIGLQDQYASAFGGLNYLQFEAGSRVRIEPIPVDRAHLQHLLGGIKLIWSGAQRDSVSVLVEQRDKISATQEQLIGLVDLADRGRESLLSGLDPLAEIGGLLNENWRLKRSLASGIENEQVSTLIDLALGAGAIAAKVAGAGGGGFILAIVPDEAQETFRQKIGAHVVLDVTLEPRGSRLVVST